MTNTDATDRVRTHLNLDERHREWARENDINLSSRVRALLDDEINEE